MNRIWIYQVSRLEYGTDPDTIELFSSLEKAMAENPGNWIFDEYFRRYSMEVEDDPFTSFHLWQCDVD